jgi:hypothetical protein
MNAVSVDDLVSPKELPMSCEYCPFDLVCTGRCYLGPHYIPKAVAS